MSKEDGWFLLVQRSELEQIFAELCFLPLLCITSCDSRDRNWRYLDRDLCSPEATFSRPLSFPISGGNEI